MFFFFFFFVQQQEQAITTFMCNYALFKNCSDNVFTCVSEQLPALLNLAIMWRSTENMKGLISFSLL